MPAAVPFIPQIIGGASAGISALLGKKKAGQKVAPYAQNPAYTKPLADFGSGALNTATQGFKQAGDYYSGVLADPTMATASDAASMGRQSQQAVQRAGRTMPRGGAQAQIIGNIPQQVMSSGLERRVGAQQNAAQNIGQLASTAGGLGTNVFGNLMGNELGGYGASNNAQQGQGYLNLRQAEADRDYYGKIGGSVYDILTGKSSGGGGSIMDKIMDKWGKKGGGSSGGGSGITWGGMGTSDYGDF